VDERQRRKAKNESLFRDVNERIEQVTVELAGASDGDIDFVCECDDIACVDRFRMTPSDYEGLRADPTAFAVAPGHEDPTAEDVVVERAGFNIVRKHPGEPARIAAEDAPR
jgi:hypothetical protein